MTSSLDDARRDLADVVEQAERLRNRQFDSPEQAYATCMEIVGRMNFALQRLADASFGPTAPWGRELASIFEVGIDRVREVLRATTEKLGCKGFSMTAAGWPISIAISLDWESDVRGR